MRIVAIMELIRDAPFYENEMVAIMVRLYYAPEIRESAAFTG